MLSTSIAGLTMTNFLVPDLVTRATFGQVSVWRSAEVVLVTQPHQKVLVFPGENQEGLEEAPAEESLQKVKLAAAIRRCLFRLKDPWLFLDFIRNLGRQNS